MLQLKWLFTYRVEGQAELLQPGTLKIYILLRTLEHRAKLQVEISAHGSMGWVTVKTGKTKELYKMTFVRCVLYLYEIYTNFAL